MNKFFLKYKGKVSEEKFFKYLDNICENQNIKAMILDFYNTLKKTDKKVGKMLSIKSFGKTPENSPYFPIYTDQAKYLFLSKKDQAKDDNLIKKFESVLQQSQEITNEKLREDTINKAFELYQIKQDKIYNQNKSPIGQSDLFRFQFVNFVNKITIEEGDLDNLSQSRGIYYCFEKEIKLFNITDSVFSSKSSRCFKLQNTINHELTHMLSMKTSSSGKNLLFTSPGVMLTMFQGANGLVNDSLLDLIRKNYLVLISFIKAEELINEVATDYYSLTLTNRLAKFYNPEDRSYRNSPERIYGAISQDLKFQDFTTYTKYGHIFEIIFRNQNNFEKCIHNSDMPVWSQYNIINSFLENTKISDSLDEQINNSLAQTFKLDIDMFKGISQFDKFRLLIGTTYHNEKKHSPFDENMMLAQSMIFDIMQKNLLNNLTMNAYTPSSRQINRQFLKGVIFTSINDAEYIDKWVIKPNIKITESENQSVWTKDVYCNTKLASLNPENPAIKAWAKYLQTLSTITHNLSPQLLENSTFLKTEFEYLNQTKDSNLIFEK